MDTQQKQEQNKLFAELAELRFDTRFYRLITQLQEMEDFWLSEFETHFDYLKDLPEIVYPGITEFVKVLAQFSERLKAITKINTNDKAQVSRKRCFEVLAYAKKWLGHTMPPNLSKLNLEALRSKVQECYPDGVLPKVTHVSYKGVLAILRGLRLAGHKVTLKAKLPQLLAQVVALVLDWESQYDHLVDAEATYTKVVQQAKADLLAVFAPPSAPAVAPQLSRGEGWSATQVPFKGLVVKAA